MSTEMNTSDTVVSPSPVRNDGGKRVIPTQVSRPAPPQPGAPLELESQGQDGSGGSNPTLNPNHNPNPNPYPQTTTERNLMQVSEL